MKLIRNKYEHEIHFVSFYSSSSGSDSLNAITLKYATPNKSGKIIKLTSDELILVVKDINILFDKIMENTLDFIKKCEDDCFKQVYENMYWRIRYSDYNKIYESDLLIKVSRAMN